MSYISHLPILLRRTLHFGCPIDLDPALPALNPFEAINDALFSGHYTLLKHLLLRIGEQNKRFHQDPYIEPIVDMWTDNKKMTKLILSSQINLGELYLWKFGYTFDTRACAPTNFEKYLVVLAIYGPLETLDAILKKGTFSQIELLFAVNMACTSRYANIETLRCLYKYGASPNISIYLTGAISDPDELAEIASWEQVHPDNVSITGLCIACTYGNLNYVRWVLGDETTITLPRPNLKFPRDEQIALFERAISCAQLEVLKVLMRHFVVPSNVPFRYTEDGSLWTASVKVIEPIVNLVGTATLNEMVPEFARKGNHNALKWIFQKFGKVPLDYNSVRCGSYEVLKLIASVEDYTPNINTWKYAISSNDYRMLMWLKQHHRPVSEKFSSIIRSNLMHWNRPRLLAFKIFDA